jgi:uncharacterized membrane protein
MNPARLAWVGVAIIFVGFLVVALGASVGSGGSSSSGGFILIGPIPIVFGSGPGSGMLAAVALVITVAMVAVYLLSFFLLRSGERRAAGAGTESE